LTNPLSRGPNSAAIPVTTITAAAAVVMRNGTSQRGGI
jgi:hypothetical protein